LAVWKIPESMLVTKQSAALEQLTPLRFEVVVESSVRQLFPPSEVVAIRPLVPVA
jgi:hypothetical protein